jgi:heme A synthase
MSTPRTVAIAGLWGAVLTVVILAMSVLLRLGADLQAGSAVSTLPQGLEQSARVAHRVAAMGVAALAALAFVAAWRGESPPRPSASAAITVIALTVLLATIGRYTPGYQVDLVTVLNVAGGVALAAAFWALRLGRGARLDRVALAALALLVVLAALGAASDAAAMRGARAFGPLHLWFASIFACLALAAAWRQRHRRVLAAATALLVLGQAGLGFAILAGGELRPLALGWLHAMAACGLALMLASLAFGRGRESTATAPQEGAAKDAAAVSRIVENAEPSRQ